MSPGMVGWDRKARAGFWGGIALGVALGLGLGCAAPPRGLPVYDYFAEPASNDPWSRKIQRWQLRERTDRGDDALGAPAPVAEPGASQEVGAELPEQLEDKYAAFRAEQKRTMAREVATWIQEQARAHYVPDGPVDRWATFGETLRDNGDDCDGLELLTFHLLRNLGFAESEVYRAIVYRRDDGQHHMVTLWFEDPKDPWVIDPTGAMTSGMPRMSEVPGWVPLKVFSLDRDFTVEQDFASR
ncbi:MAG: hypothetical protein ACR2P8_02615 [Myxococcota bacterium]